MTLTRHMLAATAAIAFVAGASAALAEDTTVTIESWRSDEAALWREKIIPAFEATNPGIKLNFQPTATGYDDGIATRLADGSAGDLIACRTFDVALGLYEKGHLAPLDGLPGLENFTSLSRAAWSTDDGKTAFCVPMGRSTLGFIYNKDIFDELGLTEPKTVAQFHEVLDRLRDDGRFVPLAMGLADGWEALAVGYENIGPTYWKGEAGRLALIAGKQKLTDENWLKPYRELARWRDYLGDGFEAQTYSDSQNLFTLGRAAIYPAGSWEIAGFSANATFAMGAFPPPVLADGDRCVVTEQAEIGLGANAGSPNIEAAKTFLSFVASDAFARVAADALPGLIPMASGAVASADPLVQEFAGWLTECEVTIRPTSGVLNRGTPRFEEASRKAVAQVIKGAETPETVAARLQAGLDGWYKPAQ
jgi:raffinose/stachyose/melibiose transport system substrate-binding protein